MSYTSTSDPTFLRTLEEWLNGQSEVLLLIRYSHAGGSKEFEFFRSFLDLKERLGRLPSLTCVVAFKDPQLPLRGTVDDNFIERCIEAIPEGSEWLVNETNRRIYGRESWFHFSAGTSHAELRKELQDSRDCSVAVGLYPPWLHDNDEVVSAVVPNEDGTTESGVY